MAENAAPRNEVLRAARLLGLFLRKAGADGCVRNRLEARMSYRKRFDERALFRFPVGQSAEILICLSIVRLFNAPGRAEIEAIARTSS
ncbi:hypothetical protein M2324_002587 [Rhodovulum sulfidophilum]|uniref:hypothetical protein n=1 Tax=Rhodovulum sulfidophilum TaxID=35806 RepID=UPI0006982D44|nr:hypothetical protein [Rhodovulum sulfidophilum]ANB34023.1 hypothetical protein A6W98_08035 [Rhodovulum sulfidophilum DSM 1374]ANB37845.1 hypothetical protein A6024_07890 [Rhodovulum sulfidophilum]MCW2304182.1 hypothetical protein [Rhodovulum sulfidophilum]